MANVRSLKIADNLTQVVQDLIDFILRSHNNSADQKKHRTELLNMMNEIKVEYEEKTYSLLPLSLIESLVYYFSRKRAVDIKSAKEMMIDADKQLSYLEIIAGFLKKGECESTSANTKLLNHLIKKLNKYEDLEADERFANEDARKGIRLALKDIFVRQANVTIQEYKRLAKANSKITKIKKIKVGTLNIPDDFKQKLTSALKGESQTESELAKRKAFRAGAVVLNRPEESIKQIEDYKPVGKLKLENFSEVVNKINEIYGNKKELAEDPFKSEVARLGMITIEEEQAQEQQSTQRKQPQIATGKHAFAFSTIATLFSAKQHQLLTHSPPSTSPHCGSRVVI